MFTEWSRSVRPSNGDRMARPMSSAATTGCARSSWYAFTISRVAAPPACGPPVAWRAVAFQLMTRRSSPGTYSRIWSNSSVFPSRRTRFTPTSSSRSDAARNAYRCIWSTDG